MLKYEIGNRNVVIEDVRTKKVITYQFNFNLPPKQNIAVIKERLKEEFFPRIRSYSIEYVEIPAEKLDKIIEEKGISLDEALEMREEIITYKEFLFEKIIFARNEVFVRNMEKKTLGQYKLNVPLVDFFKTIRKAGIESREAYPYFLMRSTFIKEIDESFRKE
jgi:hypothetical protein